MPDAREDLLARLDTTVRSWQREVTEAQRALGARLDTAAQQSTGNAMSAGVAEAQRDLERQIHEAAQQLDTLVHVLSQRLGGGQEQAGEICRLRQQLEETNAARQQITDECDRLRDKVIEREQTLDRLRGEQGDAQATLRAGFEREQEALQAKVSALTQAVEARDGDLARLNEEVGRAAEALDAQRSKFEALQAQPVAPADTGVSREKLAARDARITELEQAASTLEADFRARLEAAESSGDARIEAIESNLAALRTERDLARAALETAQAERDEARDAVTSIQGEATALRREYDAAQEAIHILRAENAELHTKVVALQERQDALAAGMEALPGPTLVDALRADVATLTARMGDMAGVEVHLREEAECLQARFQALARERDECFRWAVAWARTGAQATLGAVTETPDELRAERDALAETHAEFSVKLESARRALDEARETLQLQETDATNREEERKRLYAQKQCAEQALEEARRAGEETLHRLRAETAAAQGQLVIAEKTLAQKSAELEVLQRQLAKSAEDTHGATDQARRQLQAAETAAHEYAARVAGLEKERLSLREQLDNLTPRAAQAENLASELHTLKEERDALREQVGALTPKAEQADGLGHQLNAAEAERNTLRENIEALQEQRDTLSPRAAQAAEFERELTARQRECDALRAAGENLRTELEDLRTQSRKRSPMALISDYYEESADESQRRRQAILVAEASAGEPRERTLGEILVTAGVVSPSQLADALAVQHRNKNTLLGTILLDRGFASEDAIAQAIAAQLGVALIDPNAIERDPNATATLDRDFCMWHVCIPIRLRKDRLIVAMANPLDQPALDKIRNLAKREPRPVIAVPSRILQAIEDTYGLP